MVAVGDVFKALADPTRRAILDELTDRNGQTLFELCVRLISKHALGSSRQAISQHLAVLEDAGSSWDKLVDVTVYLTDMAKDFKTYNRIYAEYFKDNQPCRTTLGITSLPTPIAIELKCIATVG